MKSQHSDQELNCFSFVSDERSLTFKDWPKDEDDILGILNSLEEDWWIESNAANTMKKYLN